MVASISVTVRKKPLHFNKTVGFELTDVAVVEKIYLTDGSLNGSFFTFCRVVTTLFCCLWKLTFVRFSKSISFILVV